jgi:hypothetical protein
VSRENGPTPYRKRSRHPYRDSALVYAVMGTLVILIAVSTGGEVAWAITAGGSAFVLATGWTWWRLREREQRRG